MCINSACENIRNPSIHPAVHAARRRGALRGLGNLRAPQQWPWRARCPPARGWAAVCLFVVPPVTWDPLSALLTQEERGDLPAKGRAPCLPPPVRPSVLGSCLPRDATSLRSRCCSRTAPDTHQRQGLPGETAPRGRCRSPAWLGSPPGSGVPRRTGSRRGGGWSSGALRAGVQAQLMRGQSPSSLDAGREATGALAGAKLGRPSAPPRHSSPAAFWAGGPGPASRPRGAYLRTPPSPRPAPRQSTPPRSPRHRASAGGRWRQQPPHGPRVGPPRLPSAGASPPAPDRLISRGGRGALGGCERSAPPLGPRGRVPTEEVARVSAQPPRGTAWGDAVGGPSGFSEPAPAPPSGCRTLMPPSTCQGGGGKPSMARRTRGHRASVSLNLNPGLGSSWNLSKERPAPQPQTIENSYERRILRLGEARKTRRGCAGGGL